MNLSRLVRERALSVRDEFNGEFNAGGTADEKNRYPSRNTGVFRDVFLCTRPHREYCCWRNVRAARRVGKDESFLLDSTRAHIEINY